MTGVPWWLPPAGLDREDELRFLEHSLDQAKGHITGLVCASGVVNSFAKRRINRLIREHAHERDAIEARVLTLRSAGPGGADPKETRE